MQEKTNTYTKTITTQIFKSRTIPLQTPHPQKTKEKEPLMRDAEMKHRREIEAKKIKNQMKTPKHWVRTLIQYPKP